MYFFVLMEVGEPMEGRLQDGCDLILIELFLGDVEQIDDAPRMAILQYNPQVVVFEVGPEVLYYMLVVAEP